MNWIWLIALIGCSSAAYYHEPSKRLFKISGQLFGFSVSSMRTEKKLVVGDPLASTLGQVFTCSLESSNNKNACNNVRDIESSTVRAAYENQSYWFGATVKGSDNFFVACAPLRVAEFKFEKKKWKNSVGVYGHCYKFTYPGSNITDILTIPDQERQKKNESLEETMDTFGWSTDIGMDGSILIGGPAMVTGRVLKNTLHNSIPVTGNMFDTNFNFGYSLATGYFTRKNAVLIHAIGSTYGSDGHGQVSFTNNAMEKLGRIKPIDNQPNSKEEEFKLLVDRVGTMFGAVLCSAKLAPTSTNYGADLLVGAPTYSHKSDKSHKYEDYNIGAVYIYLRDSKLYRPPKLQGILVGYMSQSFFGSAIANVGDLNGDKLDEIAIAAPYENENRGAVYLYSGGLLAKANGETTIPYLQKIVSSDMNPSFFGFSLTAIQDYDDNGCNELAIGAPLSNLVVVYRCIAAITLNLLPLPNSVTNDGKGSPVQLEVCFEVDYPEKPHEVKARIIVALDINHPSAKLKNPKDGEFIFENLKSDNLRQSTPYKTKNCKTTSLELPEGGNYDVPIEYTLKAKLDMDTLKSDFEGTHVILTDRSRLKVSKSIMASECGNKCEPNLKYNNITFYPDITSYITGSSETIVANVSISNKGQVAYEPCARVSVPLVPAPLLLPLPEGCEDIERAEGSDSQEIKCIPRRLLRKAWHMLIPLNTKMLTSEDKETSLKVSLYNHCDEGEPRYLSKLIQFHSDTDGVTVTGVTDEGKDDIVNLTRSEITAGKGFQHVYTIINRGPTNWINVTIYVSIQKLSFLGKSILLENDIGGVDVCEPVNEKETDTTETYACVASKLSKNTGTNVKVLMQADDPNQLMDKISSEKIIIISNLTVDLKIANKTTGVTSELRLKEAKVEIWIIVVASILALIILLIFFFILRECGCLRRKNKENLKKVRMSVRRQTIMRNSRHSTINRQMDDQNLLVEPEHIPPSYQNVPKRKKDRRVVINN